MPTSALAPCVMENILSRKLERFAPLTALDRELLDDVIRCNRIVNARAALIREGDSPDDVHLILEGFACRSKYLLDGRRQIFAYLIPGDICDLHVSILKAMDHTIETLSPCRVVDIPRRRVLEMTARPELCRALCWSNLVGDGVLRQWMVNIGQLDALRRISHLFCELHLRLKLVELTNDGSCEVPITQLELAESVGISPVHVNRTLQELRRQNLLKFRSRRLSIPDVVRLRESCGFNPNYLHIS